MKSKNNKKVKSFPRLFINFTFFCLLIIIVQLSYVSLFPNLYGKNMKELAKSRNTYEATLYAKRGTIYDNENNALALNVASYTVIAYLNPRRTGSSKVAKHVTDPKKTAEALSPLINMSVDTLYELLTRKKADGELQYQVELGPGGRGITELVKKEIENLNLPGIEFIENYKRYYPNGDFASYILGYAKNKEEKDKEGKTVSTIVGELGLESKYNNILTGKNGYLSYQRDRYGYKIPDTKEERVEALDGSDIYLTLDSNIQRFAENAIRNLEAAYRPKWGVIAVMDARTGAILASSSIPTFDPNVRNITNYQSPFVTYTYEPGSVMKVYSYSCAIDSGKYNPNQIVKSGSIKIGDDEVRDWLRVGWGNITLDKGFAYSSNVAASTIMQTTINKTELRNCLEKFGFGDTTGVELANESSGDISFVYPIEVATAAFGQGITTTVMQQLQAMSMFANDGKTVTPRIVAKIIDPNTGKVTYESKVTKSEKLIQTSTVTKMKELMNEVVNGSDPNASGLAYHTNSTVLIGKTGTAQIASGSGGYLRGATDYIYSFSGVFPKNNPEIVIYGAIQQPIVNGYRPLSNAIKDVVNNIAKYRNMNGSATVISNVSEYKLSSYLNKNINTTVQTLNNVGINPIVIGKGTKVIKQYPSSGTSILTHDKVILITDDTNYLMPNLVGWSRKEAETLLEMLKIPYEISGNGIVVSQDVKEGTVINQDTKLTLTLANKYNMEEIK